jgi:gamma-glutamyltranspeptidase/glutathione hydrolase
MIPMKRILLVLILFSTVAARAAAPSEAAIASAHPLATEAGETILNQGGNAFDAAVAVAAALGVVEPYSSGLGGGGFWMLHRAEDGHEVMLDARETAPGRATADMYRNDEGEVQREWATEGPSAAGIPGQPAAFVHLAQEYGELPLSESLAPAIELAEDGFQVGESYRDMANWRKDVLNDFARARSIFLHNGRVPGDGWRLQQPELADTLEKIAQEGRAGFYQGDIAQKLVEGVQLNGGLWSRKDLENYEVIEREPITGTFRNARIISAAPPSSGGIVLLEMLHILETFNGGNIDASLFPHLAVESMRRAYRDRAKYLGDPDFVDMPVDKLLSRDYAEKLASSIQADQATPSEELDPAVPRAPGGKDTTHLSVLDSEGNRVSATLSINLPFGSGFVPRGTGVVLNNEMDDFSAKPGEPNAYGLIGSQANSIAPGKRPLSSMTPTFVEFDNKVALLGTPGGSRIITMVMLGVLEALEGKPPRDWVARTRFHHQYLPDKVEAEPSFIGSEAGKSLLLRDHELESAGRRYGDMQAVLWNRESGEVKAASDPRGQGLSITVSAETSETD